MSFADQRTPAQIAAGDLLDYIEKHADPSNYEANAKLSVFGLSDGNEGSGIDQEKVTRVSLIIKGMVAGTITTGSQWLDPCISHAVGYKISHGVDPQVVAIIDAATSAGLHVSGNNLTARPELKLRGGQAERT